MNIFKKRKNESLFHKVEFTGLTKTIAADCMQLHTRFTTTLVKQIVLMLETLLPTTRIRELTSEITSTFQQVIEKIHQEFSGETRLAEMEDDIRKTGEQQEAIAADATQRAENVRQMKGELDDDAEKTRSKNRRWRRFKGPVYSLGSLV